MQPKKNPEVDLEKKKIAFFMVGAAFALAIVLAAFEWKQFDRTANEMAELQLDVEEEEMVPITQQTPPPPPPPPPPEVQTIEVVDDEEEIEEEIEFDTEFDEDEEIEFVELPDEEPAEPEIFTIVEDSPEFPGGDAELMRYLGKKIQYPAMARDAGIKGMVFLQFVVMEDGNISDVKVLRGIGGGCDEEAVRVVKNMPKWKPGKQRGKPVRVRYNLPVRFNLQ